MPKKKRQPGRPRYPERPRMLATTIPESLYNQFRAFAKASGTPQSEHLAAALRTYLKRKKNTSRRKPRGKA